MNAGGIDPAIVEIEQCANIDGVVDGFFRPAGLQYGGNVVRADRWRLAIHFHHEAEQRLFGIGDGRGLQIFQNRLYLFLIPQQFRRNCGVALDSKRTIVAVRGKCRN
jgi:hypothetical protein